MPKSTILFLLTSLLLVSCGAKVPISGLTPAKLEDDSYKALYFSDPKVDYVYKANVAVYGNNLSGIFVVKRVTDKSHRVVLTTEFGNTLFDFEIGPESYKVNTIVEALDRPMLIDVLVADFRLLLRETYPLAGQFDGQGAKVLLSPEGKKSNYLFLSTIDGKLLQIKQATARKQKVTIKFHAEKLTFAEEIFIEHHDIKLLITFNHLKNQ